MFGKEAVIFTLAILSVAQENKLRSSAFGKTDEEMEEKSFDAAVSALTEFAVEEAEVITFDSEGKEVKETVSVKDYFAEKSPVKERIAHYAFRSWLVALQPSIDFL